MTVSRHALRLLSLAVTLLLVAPLAAVHGQTLPPVPVPPQNPISEAKRVLGKILFWEEQLSSDNTMACGTCHILAAGGVDPRLARHPGFDSIPFTDDDVMGSLGVVRRDSNGQPVADPLFGFDPQVTPRTAPSFITAQFAFDVLWDGRARSAFEDPETGAPVIPIGGGLESQSVLPILSDVEMAREGRTWDDVRAKLLNATPLALATGLPTDMAAAIAIDPTYPELFTAAFGDPSISATRIAFALATYERTLVADQTPFDVFEGGDPEGMTPEQQIGSSLFIAFCTPCHQPPFFTDHSFRNLGVRPAFEDIGREAVTGAPADAGRFKVPSLRGVGLRPRFMHNGQRTTLVEVIQFYSDPGQQFPGNVDPLLPIVIPPIPELIEFLSAGLTDPRVAAETFPFDRPTLLSELTTSVTTGTTLESAVRILTLEPAFPNPFNPYTTVRFNLRGEASVRITIFDAGGREIRRLGEGPRVAGSHEVAWDGRTDNGRSAGSGVYFYRVSAGEMVEGGRLVLAR